MSLESVSVETKDYKSENENNVGVWKNRAHRPLQAAPHLCRSLDATRITHPNLQLNCQRPSCIVGNVHANWVE